MNNKGMSLIEVSISVLVAMFGMSIFTFFVLSSKKHTVQVDNSLVLKQVLTDNLIELKGLLVSDLTPIGSCLYRRYNLDKSFISESLVNVSNTKCPPPAPVQNEIQVAWQTEDTTAINASFSSPFLKLPKYSDTLRKITISAWGVGDNESKKQIHNEIVIFRR